MSKKIWEEGDRVKASVGITRMEVTGKGDQHAKRKTGTTVAKQERMGRSEKVEKPGQVGRPETTEMIEKVERPEKANKVDELEKVEKPERSRD